MKIWKVVIAVMLIFGAGVATGGLLVRTRVVHREVAVPSGPTVMGTPAMSALAPGRQVFVQRVKSELDLTPEQSKEVDRVMRESHKRMAKIYEPVMPQAREETKRVRQDIQAILTPEQKKKFNEKFKRRQREGSEDRRISRERSETNGVVQAPTE